MPQPYTCPACGATSHNPNDAPHRYCGRCHAFETACRDELQAAIDAALVPAGYRLVIDDLRIHDPAAAARMARGRRLDG